MVQQYDRIIKENIQDILLDFLKETAGLQILEYEIVYPEFHSTIKRIADFVVKAKNISNEREIIHIEFQTSNDDSMLSRMLIYYSLLFEIFNVPVRQFVFYFGKAKLKMDNELVHTDLNYNYKIINFHSVSYKNFLYSENPKMVLLSILSDFEDKDAGWIIEEILLRIKNLDKNPVDFNRHFIQLDYLSVLRNLQQTVIQKQKDMALVLDIKKDLRFKEGIDEGIEKGIEKGIQKGIQKGIEKVAINMYSKGYSLELINEVTKFSIEHLKKILNINS